MNSNSLSLDNLHATDGDGDDDLKTQFAIIINALDHPDPNIRWRAIWSIEDRHDAQFGRFRLKHFHRWPRESVPQDDPYRDADPDTKAVYFPGRLASHDAKCAWAGMVAEECHGNDLRPAFDHTWERDHDIPTLDKCGDVTSDILMSCAPAKLSVCLYIDRTMIDGFLAPAVVGKKPEDREICYSSYMTNEEEKELERRRERDRHNPGLENVKNFLSSSLLRDDVPSYVRFTSDEIEQANEEAVLESLYKK